MRQYQSMISRPIRNRARTKPTLITKIPSIELLKINGFVNIQWICLMLMTQVSSLFSVPRWRISARDGGAVPAQFAIITTAADSYMQPIHARMPVILEQNEVRVWIEREGNLDDLLRLLQTP